MPETRAGKRLLVIEEALKDFVGHWYEYVRAVAEIARADGAEVTVVGHTRASEALRRELGVRPVLPRSPWDGDYRKTSGFWRKLGIPRHTWLMFWRLRAVLRSEAPFDCTFVPTVFIFHVWALRLLYGLYPHRLGRLVLLIRNNVAGYQPDSTTPQFGRVARFLAWGIRSFSGHVAAGRVVFATDSARLAEEYWRLTGIAFSVFPSPRIAAPPAARGNRKRAGPVLFACLGPARFEKGIDVLQEAIALYLADAANPPARFLIQWPLPIKTAAGEPYEPDPVLVASGQVEYLTEPLDSADYDARLASIDCMVLPYRRSSYYARISGVAVEAVTAGIPVISTADTWTSDLVETSGAGLSVADRDAAGLARAMAELARDYPAFRAAAAARAEAAAAAHSGAAFLERLWGETVAPRPLPVTPGR